MSGLAVYQAISGVMGDLAKIGIAKDRTNADAGYKYRGIDDVYNALGPALARHRLCIFPRIIDRCCIERRGPAGEALFSVTLKIAFDFIAAEDGSRHSVDIFSEALDGSDKATSKAMASAFKYAAVQTFCIPLDGEEEADARTHPVAAVTDADITPVQGWEQWSRDLSDIAGSCESEDALVRLQSTYRGQLRALSLAAPKLYAEIGGAIRTRRAALATTPAAEAA